MMEGSFSLYIEKNDYEKSAVSLLRRAVFQSFLNHKKFLKEDLKNWENCFLPKEVLFGQINKKKESSNRRKELTAIFLTKIKSKEQEIIGILSLQTVFSILIKLITYNKLAQTDLVEKNYSFDEIKQMSDEEIRKFCLFLDKVVFSSIEADLGAPFLYNCLEVCWTSNIADALRKTIDFIQKKLNVFIQREQYEILFRSLYMISIPAGIRHCLGEHYTPAWIADYLNKKAISSVDCDWIALDPCCGSGVFLVNLINQFLAKIPKKDLINKKKEVLNQVLKKIKGIDLNPLSVFTSRLNYLLAISSLLENLNELSIPVFVGDSANLPIEFRYNDTDCFRFSLLKGKEEEQFFLPKKIFLNADLDIPLRQNVLTSANDKEMSVINDFFKKLKRCSKYQKEEVIRSFSLLKNIGKVDIIVGNPPWINWKKLPPNYNKNAFEMRLLNEETSYKNVNICTLISAMAIYSFLKTGGILAFLMPKNLLMQKLYSGFRKMTFSEKIASICELDDWTQSGNPFIGTKEAFLTYYFSYKKTDYFKGVPINFIQKETENIEFINTFLRFSDVNRFFSIKKGKGVQLSSKLGFTISKKKEDINKFKKIIGLNFYLFRHSAILSEKADIQQSYNAVNHMLPFVTMRDNSSLDVRPITNESDLCSNHFTSHSVFVFKNRYDKKISVDEAFFISAILNTPVISRFYKNTYISSSFNFINIPIHIPLYDPNNNLHKQIAELAKRMFLSDSNKKLLSLIENKYLELCDFKSVDKLPFVC